MNTIEVSLIKLRVEVMALDSATNELFDSIGTMINSLKAIPDTLKGVDELKKQSDEIVEIMYDIQSNINLTWGQIETLMTCFKDKSQEESDELEKQYTDDMAAVSASTKSIGTKVESLSTKSMNLLPSAMGLLFNAMGGNIDED